MKVFNIRCFYIDDICTLVPISLNLLLTPWESLLSKYQEKDLSNTLTNKIPMRVQIHGCSYYNKQDFIHYDSCMRAKCLHICD